MSPVPGTQHYDGEFRGQASHDWGRNGPTTAGLTYGHVGGVAYDNFGIPQLIPAGTVVLTDNDVNYIERTFDGDVSANVDGFTAGRIPMAKATTAAGLITDLESWPVMGGGGTYPLTQQEIDLGVTGVDARFPYACANRYGATPAAGTFSADEMVDPATLGLIDSAPAINLAVAVAAYAAGGSTYVSDAAPTFGLARASILSGRYRCEDTVHVGYGVGAFNGCELEGQGICFRGEPQFGGTALCFTELDRPAVNFQGARSSKIKGMALVGRLGAWIVDNNLADNSGPPVLDDKDGANWNDTALTAELGHSLDTVNAPYAAITIDAYAGASPATPYGNATYPAFLGAPAQYNKNFSSDVAIEDVMISGFTVAIANQPCNADGNGDFTSIKRVWVDRCKWGISVGNSQSRNLSIRDVKGGNIFYLLTNRWHGLQRGKFSGEISDLSTYGAIGIFDFRNFYAEPLTFVNFYGETLYRIGNRNQSTVNESFIGFVGCEFSFGAQTDERGHPSDVLWDEDGFGGGFTAFKGCYFHDFADLASTEASIMGFICEGVTFEDCYARMTDGTVVAVHEQLAANATSQGFITRRLTTPPTSVVKTRPYNVSASEFTILADDGEGQSVFCPGAAGFTPTTPDSAATSITGDIDLQVKVRLDSYQPGVIQYLIRKGFESTSNPANCSYALYIIENQTLALSLSDGAVLRNTAAADISGLGLGDGDVVWFRATCDIDDGGGNRVFKYYYKLTDGAGWTQIGGTITQAGTLASIHDTAFELALMSGTFNAGYPLGRIYEALGYAGIAGVLKWHFDADDQPDLTARTITADDTLEVWTLPSVSPIAGFHRPTRRLAYSDRRYCIPFLAESVIPSTQETASGGNSLDTADVLIPPYVGGSKGGSAFSALTLVDGVLTADFNGRTDHEFERDGPDVGDLMWHDTTRATYLVYSRTGDTVLARQLSNWKLVAGIKTSINAHAATGTMYWRVTRLYTPAHALFGDTTSGDATITNAGMDDGAVFLADIGQGDRVYSTPYENIVQRTHSKIVSRSQTTQEIELTGSGTLYTATHRRLRWFIRKPPPNFTP